MRIAQRFTAGKEVRWYQVSKGTAEWVRYRPPLRDLSPRASTPSVETSVETLGYSRRSLQDAHGDWPENLVASMLRSLSQPLERFTTD
jgi:hypothetical protein